MNNRKTRHESSGKLYVSWLAVLAFGLIYSSCQLWSNHAARAATPSYTDEIFRQAVEDGSTAPLYVLITVVNDNTKQTRRICTGANFLLGAIHMQYHLSYDAAGERRGLQIALSSKKHLFHFSDSKALQNIAPEYKEADLVTLRKQTDHYSIQQLYGLAESAGWGARQRMIAYVLLDHGIACGMGDITGQLYIVRPVEAKPDQAE